MDKMLADKTDTTLRLDTRFAGTRANTNIRGSITNISTSNFTPSDLTVGVLNGMIEELYCLYRSMGEKRSGIVGSGNGVRKNKALVRIAAQIFGSKLRVSLYTEEPAPIAYMKRHLKKGLTLQEHARAHNSSVSSLESKFKSVYGVSLYQYYINLRMEEAKRLLAKTSYTVTEIAMRCGYENLFYFCNVFKKQVGMTPTEYRRLHLV